MQPPAAFVLEPVVMSTGVAEVVVGGGSTAAMVAGVVLVSSSGGSPASDHDAGPVADLQIAAQRGTRSPPASVACEAVRTGGARFEPANKVSHHISPGSQAGEVLAQSV
ncbi:MAG: hypothetical protein ACRDRF_00195 [Pseudonocardiaceae bacterium]